MYKIPSLAFLLLFNASSYALDCQAKYQQHLKTDLDLSYKEFDQTMNSGMRVLANAGCYKETADLIEAYIEKNQATQNSLRWHIAQQSAMANDYPRAIKNAQQVLIEKEDFAEQPLRWNDYVLATIAFFERDKDAMIKHRNEVAKGADAYFGNKLNLKLLDVLIKHFDKPYPLAVSHLNG